MGHSDAYGPALATSQEVNNQKMKGGTSLNVSRESGEDGSCLESPHGSAWLLITALYRTDREKASQTILLPPQFLYIHFYLK